MVWAPVRGARFQWFSFWKVVQAPYAWPQMRDAGARTLWQPCVPASLHEPSWRLAALPCPDSAPEGKPSVSIRAQDRVWAHRAQQLPSRSQVRVPSCTELYVIRKQGQCSPPQGFPEGVG